MKRAMIPKEPSLRVGALLVLSLGFLGSALLRAGEVVAALPSDGDDGFGNPMPAQVEAAEDGTPHQTIIKAPREIVAELNAMTEALEERERRVQQREMRLEVLQRHLEKRLGELRAARDEIARTASLVDDAAGKDVRKLADMFQQMKPKQAGEIFDQMAPGFAAGFIAAMRSDAAALILANMQAEKAYAISVLIAGRNVLPAGKARRSPQPPS